MTVRFTITVMTVLGLVQRPSTALVFYRHENMRLQDGHVTHTSVYDTSCRCRVVCFVDLKCSGYTIERDKENPAAYLCSFYDGIITRKNLTAVSVDQGVATHLKGHACRPPFELVPDAGCFYKTNDKFTHYNALWSCPPGSHLFTPTLSKPTVFWNLTEHLKSKYPSTNIWTSLSWNGTAFTSPEGLSVPATVGKDFWGPSDPNGFTNTEQCVAMYMSQEFKLIDSNCKDENPALCQKKY